MLGREIVECLLVLFRQLLIPLFHFGRGCCNRTLVFRKLALITGALAIELLFLRRKL
jgi:hypothetical protein